MLEAPYCIHLFGTPAVALVKRQQGPFEAEQKLLCMDKYPQDIWVNLLSKYFHPPQNKTLLCSKACCLIFVNSACKLLLKLASRVLKSSWCFVTSVQIMGSESLCGSASCCQTEDRNRLIAAEDVETVPRIIKGDIQQRKWMILKSCLCL